MNVTTSTTTLIGNMTGKMTWKKVFVSEAPSIDAASLSEASTPLSPAKYSNMTYPT